MRPHPSLINRLRVPFTLKGVAEALGDSLKPKYFSALGKGRNRTVCLKWGSPRTRRAPVQRHALSQDGVRRNLTEAPFLYVPLPVFGVIIRLPTAIGRLGVL